MINKPQQTVYAHELWRLVLCPLVTKSLLTDILFTMPVYLIFYAYLKERRTGTLQVFLGFFLINLALQLVVTALYIPVQMLYADNKLYPSLPNHTNAAFFTVLMTEIYRSMMAEGNKQIR